MLVASKRQSVADLGTPVGVGVFTPAEGLAFLAGRTGLADPDGAGELGSLPLGAGPGGGGDPRPAPGLRTYLVRLRSLPVGQDLTRKPGQPYPHEVAEAVLLSLEAVRAGDGAWACGGCWKC